MYNINMDKDEKSRLQKGWIESAIEDLEMANELLKMKRNHYSLFFCQLSLEKLLKGIFIKKSDTHPPKTHDLTKLVRLINPDIDTAILEQLAEITTFNIEARYDVYKEKLYKKADESFTKKYLAITNDLFNHFKKMYEL